MTVLLNRDALRAAYDFLCETPPFCKWNLPDSDEIEFKVCKDRALQGWHLIDGKKRTIAVSSGSVGHTATMLEVMAHEMIHVHESHSNACSRGAEHSAAFKRWAAQVCKIHGFDPKSF